MRIEILDHDHSAAARIVLSAQEGIHVNQDTLRAIRPAMSLEAAFPYNRLADLPGVVLRAGSERGFAEVSGHLPGGVAVLEVDERDNDFLIVNSEAWLASSFGVELSNHSTPFLVARGEGFVVLSGCGGVLKRSLAEGETLGVKLGLVLAYDGNVKGGVKAAPAPVNVKHSDLSRANNPKKDDARNMVYFEGPGLVWTQSHSPKHLIRWVGDHHSCRG